LPLCRRESEFEGAKNFTARRCPRLRQGYAFFAEEDSTKRYAIAVRQLHALKEYQRPREKPLRLSDVKQMFHEMKELAG
jgi:hypothetical protein